MQSIKPATASIKERILSLTQELTTQGYGAVSTVDAARMISATAAGVMGALVELKLEGEIEVYSSVISFDKNNSTRCEGLWASAVVVYRDNVEVARFVGENAGTAVFKYMHKNHSYSIDHALRHEGYKIESISEFGSSYWTAS